MRAIITKPLFLIFSMLFIASCVSSSYYQLPSANYSYRVRSLVMHFTAINYQESVDALVKEGYVSSHYLVPESDDPSYPYDELKILQLVDENERAWHAGVSYWQGRTGLNDSSIGIEIVNVPTCFEDEQAIKEAGLAHRAEYGPHRLCIFPDYDPKQIELVIQLAKDILARNPDIEPTAVVAHSDIAPSRKNDPGPRFPWYQLYEAGVGAWYDEQTMAKYWQLFSKNPPNIGLVQKALREYGYGVIETGVMDQATVDTLSAFQMHFLPWQVNGRADASTAGALFALIEKYFPERLDALITRFELESNDFESDKHTRSDQTGQVDVQFPRQISSKRALVNNRLGFKAYQGRGAFSLILPEENAAESADIFVNEQKLGITLPFAEGASYEYSLAKRTKDGINSFKIDNIKPDGASLQIQIPYPVLQDEEKKNKFDFSAVDALINQDVNNGFPGAVLLILHKGKIVKHTAYGNAQLYSHEGVRLNQPLEMSKNTIFDLASNTKVFATTLAIMKLVDDGLIDLNASVTHYLPEYAGDGREGRSVSDLLAHASGYDSEVAFYKASEEQAHLFSQNASLTQEHLLKRVPFAAGKGSLQTYSDTNFMILGALIERVVGMPLDEYVETHIYQPLGLSTLKFNPLLKGHARNEFAATEIKGNTRGGAIHFDKVREYTLAGEVHDEKAFYSMNGVAGHAGLFGSAYDLGILSQALLNGGGYGKTRLFSQATMARFVTPRYAEDSFGLGWRLALDPKMAWHFGPYASPNAFGHTGWTGTATVIDPDLDLAIVLLTNKKHTEVLTQFSDEEQSSLSFTGDEFETGRYGSVISLIYEAIFKGAP
uniref:penicillin binding protein PBP4B n=1 Tax=Ningiella ruwaisensis TaxID=2364274 RepID=UPI001448988C|nr:penicillin binding protein PBP4B [Ningiella ruwaisensis]